MASAIPAYLHSSGLEKVLEHRFIAELTSCLWLSGCRDFEVLRSEVDANEYDFAVEARGVLRHVQLKSMVLGGKRRHVTINTRLASKSAGCVVWYDYDPATLELGPFRWFGTLPGLGLPNSGEKVARHTKADATGSKGQRTGHRVVTKSRFTEVPTLVRLLPILFGRDASDDFDFLRTSMSGLYDGVEPPWLREVRSGNFDAIPSNLSWQDSVHLAHLIDGYTLARDLGLGDPFEFEERQLAQARDCGTWAGGPAVLWVTLFLEHRRWRSASPIQLGTQMEALLDRLCGQLVGSLKLG